MRGVRVCVGWHLCWMCLLRSIGDLYFQTSFLFLSCFFCSFYITYGQIHFSFSSQVSHKSRYNFSPLLYLVLHKSCYSHSSLSLCYQYTKKNYIYHIIYSQTILTSSLIPLFSFSSFATALLLTRITVFLNPLSYIHCLPYHLPYFSTLLFFSWFFLLLLFFYFPP